jgi:cell wall-associated NlpC family hydrolase
MIALWHSDYVGIPFQPNGRTREFVDCYGLICLIYREVFNIEIEEHAMAYDHCTRHSGNGSLIARGLANDSWEPHGRDEPGAVVVLKVGAHPCHCGVSIGDGMFIHSTQGKNTIVESLFSGRWRSRYDGAYLHSELKARLLSPVRRSSRDTSTNDTQDLKPVGVIVEVY